MAHYGIIYIKAQQQNLRACFKSKCLMLQSIFPYIMSVSIKAVTLHQLPYLSAALN